MVVIVLGVEDANTIPMLEGKTSINNEITYYICEGTVCRAPTNDIDSIIQILQTPTSTYK